MAQEGTQETEPAAPVIEDTAEQQIASDVLKDYEPPENGFNTDLTEDISEPAPEPQGRERDERGRFIPTDTEGTGEEVIPEISDQAIEPQAPVIEAPQGLTSEQRETFDQLPPDAQVIVSQQYKAQQADYTRKTQEIAQHRDFLDGQLTLVGRGEQYLQQAMPGVTFNDAVERFFGADAALRNPATARQTVEGLIRDYGIDMGNPQPQGQYEQPQPDVYADPEVTALKQQLAGIQGQMGQFAQHQQQQAAQPYLAAEAHQVSVLQEFRQAKGEDGNLSHPHAEAVDHMMSLMLQSPDLNALIDRDPKAAFEQAYERAVYAMPELRTSMMEASEEAARKARVAKANAVGQHTRTVTKPNVQRRITSEADAVSAAFEQAGFNGFN